MDFSEKVILTNLCMLTDGDRVLVQDRVDSRWKGVAFPGGHVEKGESLVKAVKREFYEETGLHIEDIRLCGIKDWMRDDGSRYVVLVYSAGRYTGTLRSSEEGRVFWVEKNALPSLPLAPEMDATLRLYADEALSECWYEEETSGQWVRKLQ